MRILGVLWNRGGVGQTLQLSRDDSPQVSVLVVAHNERKEIRARIDNLVGLDYPPEKVSFWVVSDGSTDGTEEIVSSYGDRVVLVRSPARIGKSLCLNLVTHQIPPGVIVLTDANTEFAPDALRELTTPFRDPYVGFVVGIQGYRTLRDAPAEYSESSYSNYETWLKQLEGQVGAVVGGDGAIMAVRRELIGTMRADDVSDLRIPLECVARGYRGYFQPTARCWESAPHVFRRQFHRKTRIIQRSIRTMARVGQVFNPFRTGAFPYFVLSHKVLRWFGPVLLAVAITNSLLLVWLNKTHYAWFPVAVIASLGIACGYGLPGLRRNKLVYLSFYFWLIQFAALVAIMRLHRVDYYTLWEPIRE